MERSQAMALDGDVSSFSTSVNWASLSADLETGGAAHVVIQPLVRCRSSSARA